MMGKRAGVALKSALSVGLLVSIVGCTPIQKGGAAGAVVGGGMGLAAGSIFHGINLGEGLLAGAAIGSLYGGLIGADICCQDSQKSMAELRELQNQLDQMKARENADLEALKQRIKELEDKCAQGHKDLEAELEKLREELKKRGLAGAVDGMEATDKGLAMTILGDTLFAPGKSKLTAQGQKTLDDIIGMIKEEFPNKEITIEGHTDAQPIRISGWRSNWELGAARSQEVLHYMIDKHKIQPSKLSATTFGEFRPRAENTTAAGMSQNRRAVIVLVDKPMDAFSNMKAR